jgi:hypothetical protein
MHVGVVMFKHPSLMEIFTLPPPSPMTNITPINTISSFTSGSLGYVDPWVVPHPNDVDSYGSSLPPTMVEIVDPKSHQHQPILVNTSILIWSVINLFHPHGLSTLCVHIISYILSFLHMRPSWNPWLP